MGAPLFFLSCLPSCLPCSLPCCLPFLPRHPYCRHLNWEAVEAPVTRANITRYHTGSRCSAGAVRDSFHSCWRCWLQPAHLWASPCTGHRPAHLWASLRTEINLSHSLDRLENISLPETTWHLASHYSRCWLRHPHNQGSFAESESSWLRPNRFQREK